MGLNKKEIRDLILRAAAKARRETDAEPEPHLTKAVKWPVTCTVGPGLEGAIACESRVGYVNGAKGWLVYRGYDIFDLCAYSTYEEVCFLLLRGRLPRPSELKSFRRRLARYRRVNTSLRLLLGFPVERMSAMAALRLGTNMMRQEFTWRDQDQAQPPPTDVISADEDSIAMETPPRGGARAAFEFHARPSTPRVGPAPGLQDAIGLEACYHLIAGVATIAAAIARVRGGCMPVEPDPELSHAANLLYMITGRRPTPEEERIMDVALILHADHGMNASTFAAMVVASTLSDIYFSVGSGIAALSGPLHGGANEQVIRQLREIGGPADVGPWLDHTLAARRKVMGFGHRVYKAYDPRARVLGPLAARLARSHGSIRPLVRTARALERKMLERGAERGIFPNVDFYSGLVYSALGIPTEDFTPIFAVSRVAGWTARVLEYLGHNRIFRPRAIYVGEFGKKMSDRR